MRVLYISYSPPSLNWDEASLGYNAYSILKTGSDEWGRKLPLTFEAFGDYKLPGYIYSLVPFLFIFDLSDFSVKIPSILSGFLSTLLIYLLVKKVTKNNSWAYLASLLFAFSPWNIFLSRIALEANLALFLFICGLYFLFTGLEKKSHLILSSIFFGITLFAYNSARVFVPLFLLGFYVIYYKHLWKIKKTFLISLAVFGIFLTAAFYLAVSRDSSSRYYWVSILDQGAISYLDNARNTSTLPGVLTNLIYNRYGYFLTNFLINYFSHFSVQFLFINGGSNFQFSLPNFGLMYLVELPFFILGLYKLKDFGKAGKVFLLWMLLAPIPAAITRESPHALRSIFLSGVIQVISAVGFVAVLDKAKNFSKSIRNIFLLGYLVLVIFSVSFFSYRYFTDYPEKYSQSWQYGYKQAIAEVGKYGAGESIYFTKKYGEPHIFYLFYTKYDPDKYQNNPGLLRYENSNWRWVDRLDNLTFLNDWEIKDKLKESSNAVLITSPGNYPDNKEVLKSIYFLDGSKAFDVVKF